MSCATTCICDCIAPQIYEKLASIIQFDIVCTNPKSHFDTKPLNTLTLSTFRGSRSLDTEKIAQFHRNVF